MSRNIEFHPTLIVGLGGTGHGVLLRLKKRFIDQFGEVPPIIQFLAIDTTQEAERQDRTADGKTEVELEPDDEHFIVRVEDAASLIRGKNPHINEWWPKGGRVGTIRSGAQQIRALGRLALFSALKEIRGRIKQKLDAIRKMENMNAMQDKGLLVSSGGGLHVYVVTSLGGGTGSGMFLDVAFISRNIVPYSVINGIFVLSRVFGQFPGTDLVKANTYTALKEIEYLSKLRDDEELRVSYGINQVVVNQPPFDMVYLIDSINEADQIIEKDKTLHAQIADGIYLLVGSEIGTGSSNAMDNIRSHIASAGLVENRYSGYCSFGVSSCTWKVKEFKAKLRNAQAASARELVEALLGSSTQKEVKADVLAFAQKCHIRENRVEDLLDEIGASRGERLETFAAKARLFPKGDLMSTMRVEHGHHLQEVERQARENASFNHERLRAEFLKEFAVWQKEALPRPDFLIYLTGFAQELTRVLDSTKDAIQEKERLAERNFQSYTFEDQGQVSSPASGGILNWLKRFFKGLSSSPAKETNHANRYAIEVDKQSRAKATTLYCEQARLLLGELRRAVDQIEADCKQFRSRLDEIQDRLKVRAQRQVEEQPDDNPFVRVLPVCPAVEQREVSLTQFRDWCEAEGFSIGELMRTSGDEIEKVVARFVGNAYKEDLDKTINDVLQIKKNEEQFIRDHELLNYLSRQAAPLWRYRKTDLPQTQNRIEKVAYCGVPWGDSGAIKNLKKGWLGGKEPQFISTIDPHRITFFNLTTGVPLYALFDLKEMKEEYDNNRRRVCHLHRNWQDLPDLFPTQIDDLVCFTLAQAPGFKFIRKNGQGTYTIYMDRQRSKPLAKDLEESFNMFQNHEDVVDVARAVMNKLSSQDRQETLQTLDEYKKELKDLISHNGVNPSTINFMRKQVKAIESYLREL